MKQIPAKYLKNWSRNTSENGPSNGVPVYGSAWYLLESNLSFLAGNCYPQTGIGCRRTTFTTVGSAKYFYHYIQVPPVCQNIELFFMTGPDADGNSVQCNIAAQIGANAFTASFIQGDTPQAFSRYLAIGDPETINTNELQLLTIKAWTEGEAAEILGYHWKFVPLYGQLLP